MLARLVLGFTMAVGPQVVRSIPMLTFSTVEQCGPVSVSFSGAIALEALPLTLTVLPFNATPISIPIPNASWNAASSAGAAITFLPFPASTTFIASLDDNTGNSAVGISDIIKVSPSSNSSCILPAGDIVNVTRYQLTGSLSQCQTFNVTFDPAVPTPSVRAFVPRGGSFLLNQTSKAPGSATFLMTAPQGQEVLLLLDGGVGFRQTTALITVAGDSGSKTDCLPSPPMASVVPSPSQAIGRMAPLSRDATVGIAVSASVLVVVIAILMAVYVHRERTRRRLTAMFVGNSPYQSPRPPPIRRNSTQKSHPPRAGISAYIVNPPYTKAGFTSPEATELKTFTRLRSSWYNDTTTSWLEMRDAQTDVCESVHSVDIEHILDIAVMHNDYGTPTLDEPGPHPRRSNDTPSPYILSPAMSPNLTPRYDRAPPKVPTPPISIPNTPKPPPPVARYKRSRRTSPPLPRTPPLSSETSSESMPSHFSTPLFTEYIPPLNNDEAKGPGTIGDSRMRDLPPPPPSSR